MKYVAPVAEVVELNVVNTILSSVCANDCANDCATDCPQDGCTYDMGF